MCVSVGAAASPAAAQANEPVLVLQQRGHAQTKLVSALRIQLSETTPIRVLDWTMADSAGLGERIQKASQLAGSSQALAVVWTEPHSELPDGTQEAVLYVVGRRQGRALLEVVRVPAGHGPDLDRTLALKVGEILAELRQASAAQPNAAAPGATQPSETQLSAAMLAPVIGTPASEARSNAPPSATAANRDTETQRSHWGVAVRAGGRLAAQLEPSWNRLALSCGAGPVLQTGMLTTALRLGVDWYPEVARSRSGDTVRISETAAWLLAGAQWRANDNVSLGARAGATFALLSAHGTTARGVTGDDNTSTLSWLLGIELEQAITAELGVATSLDIQVHALRHRFEVNSETVADLGLVQLVFGIELVWHLR
jgi:hypothetical protein